MGGQAVATEEEAGYTVSAVARRLGVAAATLRTWDRRYGVSPTLRTTGSHRRYTAADVDLLERMRSHMASGMPPADAARAAQSGRAVAPSSSSAAGDGQPGGVPKGTALQRGLARAASAMDTTAAADVIRTGIERNGTVWTWENVITPVLRSIGDKCAAGRSEGIGVDVEHHLSHVVLRELMRNCDVRLPVNPRPVLLASAPEEEHTLPLFALAAALAERGIASRLLGGRTPDEALAAAVRRLGPVAVFIWAQAPPVTRLPAAIPAIRPMPVVVVGGPGWRLVEVPADVAYPQDLTEAVRTVAGAVRPVQR